MFNWECVPYSTTPHFGVTFEYVLTYTTRVKTKDVIHQVIQICAYQNSVRHKGVLNGRLFSTNFSSLYRHTSTRLWGYFHRLCNLVHIVSLGIYCSVLEWERGLVGWGGLISNLNSVCLRFTAASWKKGYSCFIYIYFIFHQFRTNLLDMPHRIWRKI